MHLHASDSDLLASLGQQEVEGLETMIRESVAKDVENRERLANAERILTGLNEYAEKQAALNQINGQLDSLKERAYICLCLMKKSGSMLAKGAMESICMTYKKDIARLEHVANHRRMKD